MTKEIIINKLKKAFLDDKIKQKFLLPEWYDKNIKSGIDSTGFCYATSEGHFPRFLSQSAD